MLLGVKSGLEEAEGKTFFNLHGFKSFELNKQCVQDIMSLSFLGYLNGSATESAGNVFITDVPNTYMSYGNLNISGVDAMRIDSRELNSDLYIGVSAITSGK